MIRSLVYRRNRKRIPGMTVHRTAVTINHTWSSELVVKLGITPGGGSIAASSRAEINAGLGPKLLVDSDMIESC